MVFFSFLLIVATICGFIFLNSLIADKFESIANEKGHSGFFWWCFWLGIVGYMMVLALPDLYSRNNAPQGCAQNNAQRTHTPSEESGFSLHELAKNRENKQRNTTGTWTCKNCGTLNNSTNIQCKDCGKYR